MEMETVGELNLFLKVKIPPPSTNWALMIFIYERNSYSFNVSYKRKLIEWLSEIYFIPVEVQNYIFWLMYYIHETNCKIVSWNRDFIGMCVWLDYWRWKPVERFCSSFENKIYLKNFEPEEKISSSFTGSKISYDTTRSNLKHYCLIRTLKVRSEYNQEKNQSRFYFPDNGVVLGNVQRNAVILGINFTSSENIEFLRENLKDCKIFFNQGKTKSPYIFEDKYSFSFANKTYYKHPELHEIHLFCLPFSMTGLIINGEFSSEIQLLLIDISPEFADELGNVSVEINSDLYPVKYNISNGAMAIISENPEDTQLEESLFNWQEITPENGEYSSEEYDDF
jgi:hypothetical protein